MAGFFKELKRRNVFRVGIAYLIVAWLVLQIVSVLVPLLDVPDWIGRAVLLVLVAGFPVSLVIAWAFELTPEGLGRTPRPDDLEATGIPARMTRERKWDLAIIAALVVALGLSLTDQLQAPNETATPANEGTVRQEVPSIAVLPFLNLSSDPEQEYFSDGLAEELLNKLVKLEGLRVAARTSSFTFKNSNDDIPTIAAKLDVANILEGSVRKAGNEVRITAQLSEGEHGTQSWSETYERELDDIFAVQEEIAESVAQALSITLGIAEREQLKSGTQNVEAFDEYLAGLALLNEAGAQATAQSIPHLERATALDPEYADAWAVLALAHVQYAYVVTGDFETAQRRAEETARHALALGPNLAPARAALGHVYSLRHEWQRAEEEFLAAIAIPSDFPTSWDYGELLGAAGYLDETLEQRRRTRQGLPFNVVPATKLAEIYYILGDVQAAEAELARAEGLIGPVGAVVPWRNYIAMARGDEEALRRNLADALANNPRNAGIQTLLAALDAPETARESLMGLRSELPPAAAARFAPWAAYLGLPELAIELLRDRALEVPYDAILVWYPIMRDARQTQAFKGLIRDLGLAEFWRARGWPTLCRPLGSRDFECD